MFGKKKQCRYSVVIASTVFFMSVVCYGASIPCPNFDTSCQLERYAKNVQSNRWLSCFRQLYEKNNLEQVTPAPYPHVPLIIHHIWLGSALPAHYAQLRDSWRKHNPEWIFVLWTDTSANYEQGLSVSATDFEHWIPCAAAGQQFVVDVASLPFQNKVFYEATRNYGERADILRYEILYRFGGLYVDTDCECNIN